LIHLDRISLRKCNISHATLTINQMWVIGEGTSRCQISRDSRARKHSPVAQQLGGWIHSSELLNLSLLH